MFSRFEAFILVMKGKKKKKKKKEKKKKKKLLENIERSESISRGIDPPFTDLIL